MADLPNPQNYQGDVSAVRVIADLEEPSIYDRLWQPYLADLGGGRLAAAFGAHLRGKVDMGDIRCSVSLDSGATWAPAGTVFDHRLPCGNQRCGYANPVLYQAPGSPTLWCFAMRAPFFWTSGDNSQLAAAYSVDGGWSWLEVPLANRFNSPLITTCHPVMVDRPEGRRYLLSVHRGTLQGDPHGDMRNFVLESPDLLNWQLAGYVPWPVAGPVLLCEAGLVKRSDRELTMLLRTAKYGCLWPVTALDEPVAYRSTSRDGGRTWSPAEPEPGCHNTWSKGFYGLAPDGAELYVYSPGPVWERRALHWVRRQPGQSGWSQPRCFYDAANRNSYPTLLPRTEGGWNAVWDSSWDLERIRTRICFGVFTPPR